MRLVSSFFLLCFASISFADHSGDVAQGGRTEKGNPIQSKNFMGIPIPPKGSNEKPKLADSVFIGKFCHSRDNTIKHVEDPSKESAEDYYHSHPGLQVEVKPQGASGVTVQVKSHGSTIDFFSEGPKDGVWSGEADITHKKPEGVNFPDGYEFKEKEKGKLFFLEVGTNEKNQQVQTVTYMTGREENATLITPQGELVENVVAESYEKVSSDGQYIYFQIHRDKSGKIVSHEIIQMCGKDYNGGGELKIKLFGSNETVESQAKAIEKLLTPKSSSAVALPAMPTEPKLSGLSPDAQVKALDKYLADIEAYKKKVAAIRDNVGQKKAEVATAPKAAVEKKTITPAENAANWVREGGRLDANGYPYVPHSYGYQRPRFHPAPTEGQIYNVGSIEYMKFEKGRWVSIPRGR